MTWLSVPEPGLGEEPRIPPASTIVEVPGSILKAGEPGHRAVPCLLQLTPCLTQWRMARQPALVGRG